MSPNTSTSDSETSVNNSVDQDEIPDPERLDALNGMVDTWGLDSFPASDPPGSLPPSMMPSGSDQSKHPHNASTTK